MELHRKKIEKWSPRIITLGIEIPANGEQADYEDNSPEQCMIRFIELINKRNYGYLYQLLYKGYTGIDNGKGAIRELRKDFEALSIKAYEFVKINDIAPAVTEITMKFDVDYSLENMCIEQNFRLIYQSEGNASIRGTEGGSWFIANGPRHILAQCIKEVARRSSHSSLC